MPTTLSAKTSSGDLAGGMAPQGWSGKMLRILSIAAFVYLSSTIVVMASERAYWYWTGFNLDSAFLIGLFYLIPTAAALWILALTPAKHIHQVVLGGAVFAFVVEGVLTPVIYLDGPLPVMAAMFIGWHGLIAFVGFWYLARRLLVERKTRQIALAATGFGAFWGVWAVVAAVGDQSVAEITEELGYAPVILGAGEFPLYAAAVGATFAVSHWLLGFVWPNNWRPGKTSTWAVAIVAAGYMGLAVLPAVIWAPAKLAVLIGGAWLLLKRSRRNGSDSEPTIFQRLSGRIRLRDVALLMLMPAAASVMYAVLQPLQANPDTAGIIYWSLVSAQIIAGAAAYLWAWRRARHSSRTTAVPVGTGTP